MTGHLQPLVLMVTAATVVQLYHCTRESFLYLAELYVGELAPEDRHLVPPPGSNKVGAVGSEHLAEPSKDFLEQLKSYTTFRLPVQSSWKSF